MKPYKAKTLAGAQARVRNLLRQRDQSSELLDQVWYQRNLLARLAADGPCFDNPLEAMKAKTVRDQVLKSCGLNPDGTRIK